MSLYRRHKRKHRSEKVTKEQKAMYEKYLRSQQWFTIREQALEFHGRCCGSCGSKIGLQVHHKTYDNLYHETMADLMILCKPCHKDHHWNEKKKWINRNGRRLAYMKDPSYRVELGTFYPDRKIN